MLDILKPMISSAVSRRYSAGSTIVYQGEVPRAACIIIEGVVRVYSISDQGDEQIVTFHIEGEFFPASWMFQKTPSALFFYEAMTDCEVAFVPQSELNSFIMNNPEYARSLLDYFITSYTASLIRINALEQPKARSKLTYTLFYLCQRYGKKVGQKVRIPIGLTHQQLASMVGLTRETTSMEMNKLRKQGVLTYGQKQYSIDVDKLLGVVGEESFRNISIR